MKNKHLLMAMAFFALAISFGSCSKDEELTKPDAGTKNNNIEIEDLRGGDTPPSLNVNP